MDGIGLSLLAAIAIAAGIGLVLRQRYLRRLQITHHEIRCPKDDCRGEIAVQTDPRAPSGRQYVEVASCSLLSGAAIGLPDRMGYLREGPPWRVCLEPANPFPVYDTEVACGQPCLFALNAAESGAPRPVTCTSGVSDAIGLAQQAGENPRMARLVWYASS